MKIYESRFRPIKHTADIDEQYLSNLSEHATIIYDYIKENIEKSYIDAGEKYSIKLPNIKEVAVILSAGHRKAGHSLSNHTVASIFITKFPEFVNLKNGTKLDFEAPNKDQKTIDHLHAVLRYLEIEMDEELKLYDLFFEGIKTGDYDTLIYED